MDGSFFSRRRTIFLLSPFHLLLDVSAELSRMQGVINDLQCELARLGPG